MGYARTKLNIAYMNGFLLLAGLIGFGTQSWSVFIGLTVLFVLCGIAVGEIRLRPTRR